MAELTRQQLEEALVRLDDRIGDTLIPGGDMSRVMEAARAHLATIAPDIVLWRLTGTHPDSTVNAGEVYRLFCRDDMQGLTDVVIDWLEHGYTLLKIEKTTIQGRYDS